MVKFSVKMSGRWQKEHVIYVARVGSEVGGVGEASGWVVWHSVDFMVVWPVRFVWVEWDEVLVQEAVEEAVLSGGLGGMSMEAVVHRVKVGVLGIG